MAKNEIVIVSVPVADQARAKAFYLEKLGFSLVMESKDAMGPDRSWIMLKPAGGGTAITLVNWFDTMPAGSLRGLVIGVADLETEHALLRDAGVDIDEIKSQPWGRFATLRDSEGNGIVLQKR